MPGVLHDVEKAWELRPIGPEMKLLVMFEQIACARDQGWVVWTHWSQWAQVMIGVEFIPLLVYESPIKELSIVVDLPETGVV
jgi:hypothetical protein